MKHKEKVIIASACVITTAIAAGFTITQGEMKSNIKDYKPTNITDQNDIKTQYKLIEKDISENSYTIQINKEVDNQELLQIAQEIVKENNEEFTIYIKEENNLQTQISKNEKQTLITRYIQVEKEVEGLPKNYKVLAIEPFEEKTRISIEIPKSNDPNVVLGQIKTIGQKVKEEEASKDNYIGNLEIKAYYNEDDNYWSYTSSNKNIIMHNQVIQN